MNNLDIITAIAAHYTQQLNITSQLMDIKFHNVITFLNSLLLVP
jgi:hypothetical protein